MSRASADGPLAGLDGPSAKLVGTLAGKLDRRSVHLPHYKPGDVLCALGVKDKFILFVHDTVNPFTLLNVAFNSAVDQAENSERVFGQGMKGYSRRVGANEPSDASGVFFRVSVSDSSLRGSPLLPACPAVVRVAAGCR